MSICVNGLSMEVEFYLNKCVSSNACEKKDGFSPLDSSALYRLY